MRKFSDKASQANLNPTTKAVIRACREDPNTLAELCKKLKKLIKKQRGFESGKRGGGRGAGAGSKRTRFAIEHDRGKFKDEDNTTSKGAKRQKRSEEVPDRHEQQENEHMTPKPTQEEKSGEDEVAGNETGLAVALELDEATHDELCLESVGAGTGTDLQTAAVQDKAKHIWDIP